MMMQTVFKAEMEILMKEFKPDSYTERRLKEIWETCKHLSDERFRQICKRLIASLPKWKAPMVPEFESMIASLRDLEQEERDKEHKRKMEQDQYDRNRVAPEQVSKFFSELNKSIHIKPMDENGPKN